ncbi:hypothetical protein E2C01_023780 [Portunus trituberculatus]|uniref:Uncharacterized protein n=1 Tax=Portunus trituberculatus TaxID=210409 RepID=A0A5B7E929_PORTR|nr:hypothetical protein [Portunus trituberculatus]
MVGLACFRVVVCRPGKCRLEKFLVKQHHHHHQQQPPASTTIIISISLTISSTPISPTSLTSWAPCSITRPSAGEGQAERSHSASSTASALPKRSHKVR